MDIEKQESTSSFDDNINAFPENVFEEPLFGENNSFIRDKSQIPSTEFFDFSQFINHSSTYLSSFIFVLNLFLFILDVSISRGWMNYENHYSEKSDLFSNCDNCNQYIQFSLNPDELQNNESSTCDFTNQTFSSTSKFINSPLPSRAFIPFVYCYFLLSLKCKEIISS
jgi:hypothetical protein